MLIKPDQNVWVYLYDLGILTTLCLNSAEVNELSADDTGLLRDAFGMGDPMYQQLRRLARVPGRALWLDFEYQAVVVAEVQDSGTGSDSLVLEPSLEARLAAVQDRDTALGRLGFTPTGDPIVE